MGVSTSDSTHLNWALDYIGHYIGHLRHADDEAARPVQALLLVVDGDGPDGTAINSTAGLRVAGWLRIAKKVKKPKATQLGRPQTARARPRRA